MTTVTGIRVRPDLHYLTSGWSMLVTDVHGRVPDGGWPGFYVANTRVLSREDITVDGRAPTPFSTGTVGTHAQLSYAEVTDGEPLPSRGTYLLTRRFVGPGLRTRLTLARYSDQPLAARVEIALAADFADATEVERNTWRRSPSVETRWDETAGELRLVDQESGLDRQVVIRVDTAPAAGRATASYVDHRLVVTVSVPAHGETSVDLLVEPVVDGQRLPAPPPHYTEPDDPAGRARATLTMELTRLRSRNPDLTAAWRTAITDLAGLPLGQPPGPAAPIAGLPVYQHLFGRDTLTVSWQALLAGPTMLRDSLRLNAAHLGQRIDDWRDEEPGKLLHQHRRGPLSELGHDPLDHYFGDFATPPDFLVFLGQYLAWTGDLDTVRQLLPAARKVLAWLDRYGATDGFQTYRTRSAVGVKNQGWKDSETAIVDEHGRSVPNPIAPSELQGYWYAALRHSAWAFAACGDRGYAATLLAQAAKLRRRFHRRFWLPEYGCYAMALDPHGRPVRSVNSNDGHLLATGIVPHPVARRVADRLFAPDMFSGWGIRTLSDQHPAYNPFSYHRGSVWPVEAGTIGIGLARYGLWSHLHRLVKVTLETARLFEGHRLPEALGGLPRDSAHPHPGVYPRSCSPQAWSASTIIALVQALLAFRPVAALRTVLVDPHLPEWLPDLELEGVQVGHATFDLQVRRRARGRAAVRTRGDRVAVVRMPTLQTLWSSSPILSA